MKKISFLLLSIVFLLSSCSKDEDIIVNKNAKPIFAQNVGGTHIEVPGTLEWIICDPEEEYAEFRCVGSDDICFTITDEGTDLDPPCFGVLNNATVILFGSTSNIEKEGIGEINLDENNNVIDFNFISNDGSGEIIWENDEGQVLGSMVSEI
ncbi:MAG: hypothetical protein U9R42_02815 [Bacteroidota bacterium]|nr:hypothetical protein [Bacteroidota bacterium]